MAESASVAVKAAFEGADAVEADAEAAEAVAADAVAAAVADAAVEGNPKGKAFLRFASVTIIETAAELGA